MRNVTQTDTLTTFEESHSTICRNTNRKSTYTQETGSGGRYVIILLSVTHHGNLAALLTRSDTQLVDGGLGDVGSLLGVVQLVLNLPEADRAAAHLLLLVDTRSNDRESCWTSDANFVRFYFPNFLIKIKHTTK